MSPIPVAIALAAMVPPSPAPIVQDDVLVSSPGSADQNETSIAVDRHDRLHLVAGHHDQISGAFACVFHASFDGGLHWSELAFPDPGRFGDADHPRVAISADGRAYFVAHAYSSVSALYVGRSDDGGVTVANWVEAVSPLSSAFDDRPEIAIDTTSGPFAGAVYLTFTRFGSHGAYPILVTQSFNDGQKWKKPRRVSDSAYCQGACPAVGPNGELDVVFYDFSDSTIRFDRSLDGGFTWGTDVKISAATFLDHVPNAPFRTNSFPSIGIDGSGGPYHGRVYVVWAANAHVGTGADIHLSKSSDGGATWTTPVVVNDVAGGSQFSPWIDVDANGNVNVGFYDRRDDPADTQLRYYVARSSDGGATFQPNVVVSDVAFDANSYPQGAFIGDRTAIAASDRTLHPLWTDGRNGDNDVYTARVQLDLHTDVDTLSASTGGTVNFTIDPGPLYANDAYRILGSVTGTSPGISFRHVNVPVNYDPFMLITIKFANSSAMPGFVGTLDANGMAAAALVSGPLSPSLVGVEMDFATFVKSGGAVRWASNPAHLVIGN